MFKKKNQMSACKFATCCKIHDRVHIDQLSYNIKVLQN